MSKLRVDVVSSTPQKLTPPKKSRHLEDGDRLLDATPPNFHDKKYKGIDPPLSSKVMAFSCPRKGWVSPFLFFAILISFGEGEGSGLFCPVHTKFLHPLLPQSNPDVG